VGELRKTCWKMSNLGLAAQGIAPEQRKKRALAAAAAGRSRRALVVNPKVVLMDELFSTLDVLTAETLHTDLWICGARDACRSRPRNREHPSHEHQFDARGTSVDRQMALTIVMS
jgi:hypothetical protein